MSIYGIFALSVGFDLNDRTNARYAVKAASLLFGVQHWLSVGFPIWHGVWQQSFWSDSLGYILYCNVRRHFLMGETITHQKKKMRRQP